MDEPAVVDGVGTGAAQLEVTNSALTAQEVPSTPAPISKEIILSDTVIAEKPGGEEGVEFGATIGEDYEAAALRDGDSDDDEDDGVVIISSKSSVHRTPMKGGRGFTARTPMTGREISSVPNTAAKDSVSAEAETTTDDSIKRLRFNRHFTAFDVDINALEEQPWRNKNVDVSDYFNYGFTERTWMLYCEKQLRLRAEKGLGPRDPAAHGNKPAGPTVLNSSITSNMVESSLRGVSLPTPSEPTSGDQDGSTVSATNAPASDNLSSAISGPGAVVAQSAGMQAAAQANAMMHMPMPPMMPGGYPPGPVPGFFPGGQPGFFPMPGMFPGVPMPPFGGQMNQQLPQHQQQQFQQHQQQHQQQQQQQQRGMTGQGSGTRNDFEHDNKRRRYGQQDEFNNGSQQSQHTNRGASSVGGTKRGRDDSRDRGDETRGKRENGSAPGKDEFGRDRDDSQWARKKSKRSRSRSTSPTGKGGGNRGTDKHSDSRDRDRRR